MKTNTIILFFSVLLALILQQCNYTIHSAEVSTVDYSLSRERVLLMTTNYRVTIFWKKLWYVHLSQLTLIQNFNNLDQTQWCSQVRIEPSNRAMFVKQTILDKPLQYKLDIKHHFILKFSGDEKVPKHNSYCTQQHKSVHKSFLYVMERFSY